jgi:hypothetical protein
MKTSWGSGGISPRILDLVIRWGKWSVSPPGRFIPRERAPGTHCIGGWLGPRASLDTVVKRKFPAAAGTRTPDHSARSPPLYHWDISAPVIWQERYQKAVWIVGLQVCMSKPLNSQTIICCWALSYQNGSCKRADWQNLQYNTAECASALQTLFPGITQMQCWCAVIPVHMLGTQATVVKVLQCLAITIIWHMAQITHIQLLHGL